MHDDTAYIEKRQNSQFLEENWKESYIHLANLYMIASEYAPAPGHCLFPIYQEAEQFVERCDLDNGVAVQRVEVKI